MLRKDGSMEIRLKEVRLEDDPKPRNSKNFTIIHIRQQSDPIPLRSRLGNTGKQPSM